MTVISWQYLFSSEDAFNVYFGTTENKTFCLVETWLLGLQHHAAWSSNVLHLPVTHILGWLA